MAPTLATRRRSKVRRGFCSTCGSSLFWDPSAMDWIAIAMGAFESPTSALLEKHVFVAEKGDCYEITDDLPQKNRFIARQPRGVCPCEVATLTSILRGSRPMLSESWAVAPSYE